MHNPSGTNWHCLNPGQTARRLEVDPGLGLTAEQVLERRSRFGSNALVEQ